MGAAAGIPASAVELLLRQDGKTGTTVSNNCTADTIGYTETFVAFPAGSVGNSTEDGQTYQNLQTGKCGIILKFTLAHCRSFWWVRWTDTRLLSY